MKTAKKKPGLKALKSHLRWVVRQSCTRGTTLDLALGVIDKAPNKKVLRDRLLGTFPFAVTEANFLGF